MKINNLSYKNIIRSFSIIITEIRDNLLRKVSLDINKWLNDEYTNDNLDKVIEKIKEKIFNITKDK